MSILSTNRKLIRVGTEYSAGPNIDIQDDIISGKDWTAEIAEASANAFNAATAKIPDPFDPSYISGQIDNKLDTTAFTAWQNGQYATALQTIEGQISNKLDASSFSDVSGSFYTNDNPSGFITGVDLSPYYTTAEANSLSSMLSGAIDYVSANAGDDFPQSADEAIQTYQQNSGTYLTENDIVNKLDISAFTAWSAQEFENDYELSAGEGVKFYEDDELKITRIDVTGGGGGGGDEEVNSFVYNNSASINDVNSSYKTYSSTFLTALPSDLATTGDLDSLSTSIAETYYPNTNPSSFVNEDWVTAQGYITGVDLSDYAKRDFVLSSVESATSGKLDVSSFASVSSDFLTNDDLNGYATESFVENVSGDITALIPTDYATITQINELSGAIDYVSANAGDEFPASANEAITTYQTNSGLYLTAHQDISNKVDLSAYNELKQSYDVLSSLFATYSGQWLLPNEGV